MNYDIQVAPYCLRYADPPCVGIIMSSDSDLHVMKDAARILSMFGVANEVTL